MSAGQMVRKLQPVGSVTVALRTMASTPVDGIAPWPPTWTVNSDAGPRGAVLPLRPVPSRVSTMRAGVTGVYSPNGSGGAVAVPVTTTSRPVPPPPDGEMSSKIVSRAVRSPFPSGAKRTLTVHDWPTLRLAPAQSPEEIWNCPASVPASVVELIARFDGPLLVIVTAWEELVSPPCVVGNVSIAGEMARPR